MPRRPGLPRPLAADAYIDFMRRTAPVFYVPLQGSKIKEVMRDVTATLGSGIRVPRGGPFGMQATEHDGTINGTVTVATDTSYHPGDTFSCGGWFNRLGAGDPGGPILLHTNSDFVIWFSTINAGYICLRKPGVADVACTATNTWGSPYTRGWHHIMFTKTGSSMRVYLDGEPHESIGSNQTMVAGATDITVGWGGGSLNFAGRMAHWAIWNRVLAPGEVQAIYRAGIAG